MTFDQFVADVDLIHERMTSGGSTARYGQVFFRHLQTVNPGLSNKVRFTGMDPFYSEQVSQECLVFCAENWVQ